MSSSEATLTNEGGLTGPTGEVANSVTTGTNVGQTERWVSAVGGGALALYGLTRGSLAGVGLALAGAALLHRGYTGHCNLYEAIGYDSSGEGGGRANDNVSVPAGRGVKVEKSVTINRPPEELYRFWRNFDNLPQFMNHLESVTTSAGDRSHWVAKGPAGTSVEWDAEVYNDKPNEMIAWRSLEGSQVDNAGSVHFEPAAGGGTEVRVVLKYDPPAGKLGAAVARLFGESPAQQIEDDLNRLKQLIESGEVSTATDQTSGRAANA